MMFRLGLLTFGVSVLLGNPLTAASTFTSVALLNMLIGPLNAFPWVLNGLIEAWVSLKRVQGLVDVSKLSFNINIDADLTLSQKVEEINLNTYYSAVPSKHPSRTTTQPTVFKTENASFEFDKKINCQNINVDLETVTEFKLDNVNVDIRKVIL